LVLTSPHGNATTLFRQLKGVVSQLLEQAGYEPEWLAAEAAPAFAPWLDLGSTTSLVVRGESVGYVSVAPAEAMASVKVRQPVAVAELDITRLAKIVAGTYEYQPIAKFPSIVEDISLLVDQGVAWASLKQFCAGYHPLISAVELFDVYEGAKIGTGKRSLAFHITFSSPERTLVADEAHEITKALAADIAKKFKAEIR
jgi:phenylalanyl-tRNA synthetase beta chain